MSGTVNVSDVLLEVKGLKKYFPVKKGIRGRTNQMIRAVDGVTFAIRKGETFSLVGESGSGKSTTAKSILRLIEPTAGEVYFEGRNIAPHSKAELRLLRRRMQLIFQNPYMSLNPRMKVGDIVTEPAKIHGIVKGRKELRSRALDLLEAVGLTPPEQFVGRYPYALSGGQRQRVMIARVLSLNPSFIVADEPVSALDVSLRSQILNLLRDLRDEFGLTYLLITHDLSVVEYMSDTTAVMYLGRIVELGPTEAVLGSALHPYTQMLMSAVPIPDPSVIRETVPAGERPSTLNLPTGCRFRTRCPYAFDRCNKEDPELLEILPSHYAACFLNHKG